MSDDGVKVVIVRLMHGRRVAMSKHAAVRFQERVRPALALEDAVAELRKLIRVADLRETRPAWCANQPAAMWLVISDCAAFPLREAQGCLLAVTCIVPGGKAPDDAEAYRKHKQGARQRRHAKRRGDRRPRRADPDWRDLA